MLVSKSLTPAPTLSRGSREPGGPTNTLRARTAAVTIELALVAPVFFFLVFGIIEVGRGFMVSNLLANSARDGCRTGVLRWETPASSSQIETIVLDNLRSQGVTGANVTVEVNGVVGEASTAKPNDQITVIVAIPVGNFTWLPGGSFLKGSISGQYTLRRE